jgi:hypothetical protein
MNDHLDGLSIPFFSLGGTMHSRTRSLISTLTRTEPNDWLIGVRRGPVLPQPASGTTTVMAVEENMREERLEEGRLGNHATVRFLSSFFSPSIYLLVFADHGRRRGSRAEKTWQGSL